MFYRHKNGNLGLFCLQHENYSVFSHQIKYIYLPKVKPFIILPNNGQCHPFYVPYSNIRSEELMWSFRDSPCLSILLSPTTSILQQSFFILSPSSSARKCCMMLVVVGRNHHGNQFHLHTFCNCSEQTYIIWAEAHSAVKFSENVAL